MGDRGNIAIQYAKGQRVYFYTHWCGSEITEVVKNALKRKERWDDDSYLARIIFCELVELDGNGKSSTGFGICLEPAGDREHPILVVDCENQAIFYEERNGSQTEDPVAFGAFIR